MRVAFKPFLEQIWHAPDNFWLMDPLPLAHRRGIIIGAIIMMAGFLLPGESSAPPLLSPDTQLDLSASDVPISTRNISSQHEQPEAILPDTGSDNNASCLCNTGSINLEQ